jgi:hypothetical protein
MADRARVSLLYGLTSLPNMDFPLFRSKLRPQFFYITFQIEALPQSNSLDFKSLTNMSAQPTKEQGYEASGNTVSKNPAERANASAHGQGDPVSTRSQNDTRSEPQSSALGKGIHGAPAGEEAKGYTEETIGRHNELDAEQMAAPGEGRVAAAVDNKPGATGAEPGLESDLDRKKKEQAPLREANEEKRESNVDVGGVLGQRGGPASTVD